MTRCEGVDAEHMFNGNSINLFLNKTSDLAIHYIDLTF